LRLVLLSGQTVAFLVRRARQAGKLTFTLHRHYRPALPLDPATRSSVGSPSLLSGSIRHAWIVSTRRFSVTLRLRAPDLRREVSQQRQLLHHSEVVRWRRGRDR